MRKFQLPAVRSYLSCLSHNHSHTRHFPLLSGHLW
jgi:hypothetical protein